MHDQAAAFEVENPILGDTSSGVQTGLHREVKDQRGFRYFHHQVQLLGSWTPRSETGESLVQNDEIGFGLTGRVILRSDVDRSFRINAPTPPHPNHPPTHQA